MLPDHVDIVSLSDAPEFWIAGFLLFELMLILVFVGLWLACEKKQTPSRD